MKFVCWLLAFLIGAANASPPYHILVTNDDGIGSPGIAALAAALGELGDVVVVAPKSDQSGMARASTVFQTGVPGVVPLLRDGRLFGYAVDGTPTDCVLVGMRWLRPDRKFDIVVSGINFGANLGTTTLYSGTVGAAVEAALAGIPAVAVSQDHRRKDYTRSATIATRIVERVLRQGLAPNTLLNVNIPAGNLRGVKVAPTGSSDLALDRFEPIGRAADGSTGLKLKLKRATQWQADTDTAYYMDGWVTVTPLQADLTARSDIGVIQSWALELPPPDATPANSPLAPR